jgi:hypothetical protein
MENWETLDDDETVTNDDLVMKLRNEIQNLKNEVQNLKNEIHNMDYRLKIRDNIIGGLNDNIASMTKTLEKLVSL